jgi:hypothetical protein
MPTGKVLGLKYMTMDGLVPIDSDFIAVVPYKSYYSTSPASAVAGGFWMENYNQKNGVR